MLRTKERILYETRREREDLEKYQRKIRELPEGHLTIEKRGDKNYYRWTHDGTRRYLRQREKPLTDELKFKMLLLDMCGIIQNNLIRLEEASRIQSYDPNLLITNPASIYADLPGKFIRETGFTASSDLELIKADTNIKFKDSHIYQTLSGYMVTSSHEQFIADLYTHWRLAFKYEPEIILRYGKTIHPDFLVHARTDDRLKYHEHCGMMNDIRYRDSTMWKMEELVRAGYYFDYNLIFTFGEPDGSYNPVKLEKILAIHML